MITSFLNRLTNKLKRVELNKLSIIFLLLFSGCSSFNKSEEVVFLENVMIREGGIYVLMGSKPMSTFPIEDSGFPETEEEIQEAYQLYLSEIQAGNLQESPTTYATFAENCQNSIHFHYRTLWSKTKERLKEYVGPRYRFVERRNPFGEQRKAGLFINVPNMLSTLNDYYQDFAEIYGGSFDPERVLDEIGNEESPFWTKIFRSNYAQGLLFGYGKLNSYEFDWRMKNAISTPRLVVEGQATEPLTKKNIKPKDLRLPNISIYSASDKKLEKYKNEREIILNELDGEDFEKSIKLQLNRELN